MKYDAAYFIAKFEAIPEEEWLENGTYRDDDGRCCALGHCGAASNWGAHEAVGLREIAKQSGFERLLIDINDGLRIEYQQPTPKQRVLAWLRDAQEAGL